MTLLVTTVHGAGHQYPHLYHIIHMDTYIPPLCTFLKVCCWVVTSKKPRSIINFDTYHRFVFVFYNIYSCTCATKSQLYSMYTYKYRLYHEAVVTPVVQNMYKCCRPRKCHIPMHAILPFLSIFSYLSHLGHTSLLGLQRKI